MSPRTKEQFEEIRKEKSRQIVSAALELFATHGYEATSINMIANKAGISKGLLYTYFESKESLLFELINDYLIMLGSLLNPNDDDEITASELNDFLDGLRTSILEDNEYWRLWAQFSLQPETIGLFLKRFNSGEVLLKHQRLLSKYFEERFDDHKAEEFFFTSLVKGFTIQYAFATGLFPDELVDAFFTKLKAMYIIDKKKKR